MKKGISLAAWIAFAFALGVPVSAQTIQLSGATFFQADGTGAFSPSDRWNTLNSGEWGRAWFARGAPNGSTNSFVEPFINGPGATNAALAIELTPGVHEFTSFMNDGTPVTYHGVNLYFDGNLTTPRISAFAQDQTSMSTVPPFFANGSASTLALMPYSFDGNLVPGAGTLVYQSGTRSVTLTQFTFTSQFLHNIDRVNSFSTTPDGQPEKLAYLRFEVTDTALVPESGGALLLMVALLAVGVLRRGRLGRSAHRMSSAPPK